MAWVSDSKSLTDIFCLSGFLYFSRHGIPLNIFSLLPKKTIPPQNSTFPGSQAPGPPEGAFSKGGIFTLNLLLEESVLLDLTDKRCHLHLDLVRVDNTEAVRWKSEVWVGDPRLTCPSQGWERRECQTNLHLNHSCIKNCKTVDTVGNPQPSAESSLMHNTFPQPPFHCQIIIWKHTRYFKTIHWPGARFETSGSGREIAPS